MNIELFLIRHGETDYNCQRKYCSFSEIPLNGRGISQAAKLSEHLPFVPDVIYTSISKRAKQTANVLFPLHNVISTHSLSELNFGLWEGLTHDEIYRRYGESYTNWLKDPVLNRPASGEGLDELKKRIVDFLEDIFKRHENKKVIFVSHAGPIKIIISHFLNKDFRIFWDIEVDNASFSWFKIRKGIVTDYFLNRT